MAFVRKERSFHGPGPSILSRFVVVNISFRPSRPRSGEILRARVKSKPVIPRELASRDVEEAIEHYRGESAVQAALGFIDALEQACAHISRQPATGSARYAHELNLPGPRCWPLTRYSHLVFYVGHGDAGTRWSMLGAGCCSRARRINWSSSIASICRFWST